MSLNREKMLHFLLETHLDCMELHEYGRTISDLFHNHQYFMQNVIGMIEELLRMFGRTGQLTTRVSPSADPNPYPPATVPHPSSHLSLRHNARISHLSLHPTVLPTRLRIARIVSRNQTVSCPHHRTKVAVHAVPMLRTAGATFKSVEFDGAQGADSAIRTK